MAVPSSWTSTVNVNASPGSPVQAVLETADIENSGGGGGVSTVTVELIDPVPTEAVTVYEPEASLPSLSEVLTFPSLSVVAVVTLNDTVPSSGLTLNVTVCPSTGLPSSVTLRVNGNEPPGWPGQGLVVIMRTNPDGGEVPTVAVPLTDSPLIDAETVYEPEASLPRVSVVLARPLLPVVVLVGLSDAVPSSGLTLNVTVCPCVAVPSSRTSTTNVNASPGSPDPGLLITTMDISGSGGGGGVSTVAVPLTDWVPSVAVTVYEPEASLPRVSVVLARPLLPVVALVGLSDAVPLSGLTLNVTVCPCVAVPSSRTSTVNVNASPGSPDPGLLITTMDISGGGGGGGVSTVAVPLTDWVPSVAVTVYEPEASLPRVSVVLARPLLPVVALVGLSDAVPLSGLTLNVTV